MCGRYASARSVEDLASTFGIASDDIETPVAPDWNVAPTKPVPAVVVRHEHRTLREMRWGLVPLWAKDPTIGSRFINARIESVAEKPAFRDALVRRRCLLPADGWYEWSTRPDGVRQPYYLAPADASVLAFAGLWERWRDADGEWLITTTVVTGPAPDDLAAIHDRAPVVMPTQAWADWLDPANDDPRGLLVPTPAGLVVPRPVGTAVGDVRNNGPELVEPVDVSEQPPLF